MPSRSRSSVDDDDFRDTLQAMAQSSPVAPAPAAKRTHQVMARSDDDTAADNEDDAADSLPGPTNKNIIAAAKRYGERKRLRTDQIHELTVFVNEPASLREAKLLATLFALDNKVDKIVTSKPAYEVSTDLEKNIANYVPAVLLSSKITSYKGNGPKDVLLNLLKKHRGDMPVGIENIPSDWSKVTAVTQETLTQKRSNIKKAIQQVLEINWSLKINKTDTVNAPAQNQQNIFDLTQALVKGTQCTVNIELCARVALMRAVYLKHPDSNYWNKVDVHLAKIREEADGDLAKVNRAFRHLLTADQNKHGVKDYTLEEKIVDEFQQEVDDLIVAGLINTATSAQDDDDVD
ncbi:hypothetical protein C8R43DRAFT_954770 [Mycena crocata]|nr:hypothetical protein C8R43DRAFT_954770 [Mycena crocata]